jgi:hypothetical protein
MYDIETKQQFIRLRARGASIREIAEHLNISKNTITDWNSEYAEKITDAQREEMDGVLLELGVDKVARLRDLARYYNRMKEDLDKELWPGKHRSISITELRELMRLHQAFNKEGILPNLRKQKTEIPTAATAHENVSGTKPGQK